MGAGRKTGKEAPPGLTGGSGRPDAVAADRVSYLTIGPEAEGQRLDNFLLRIAKGVPKSHVYRVVRSGEVRVNKGRAAVDYRLAAGDVVRVPPIRVAEPRPAGARLAPAEMPPILYEDEHLIVVDKPAGLAAHGGSGIAHGLIERVRAARPNQPFLELAHRLDRDTSGLLLLAKTRRALVGLHEQLRDGKVDKRYRVLVKGDWVNDRQHVRLALTKYLTREGERRVNVDPEGAESHTVFTLIKRYGRFSLLEAELRTGRTHQIRVHLAHLGFPIVGDDKYGDFELNKAVARADARPRLARMFLHAGSVRLSHPVSGQPLAFEAPLPPECLSFLKALDVAPL
ncbi:MAG: RluA family pseudouridine synthase [Burkholderiaceae bacterium]|jgi:23S rRNA pseudouridine955/2504/2580 synthase|nr:RluA family pseudouridine synthase [Burkholderiaceae bacterium]